MTSLPPDRVRFGVVINDIPATTQFPVALSGWELDWARPHELDEVTPVIRTFASPHIGSPHQEMTLHPQEAGGVQYRPAARDEWRYCVVRPRPEAVLSADKLAEALRVSDADLWVETWVPAQDALSAGSRSGTVGRLGAVGQYWADWVTRPLVPPPVPVENLVETVWHRASLDDQSFRGIARALRLFRDLDAVTETSPAKVLGYFSVLESLLSHAPHLGDPVDSISRQLKRNLVLVDHRLPAAQRLPLGDFADSSNMGQVIGKLYSVRSAFAHGGAADVEMKWLEARRPSEFAESPSWLPGLMRQVTQRVLQAALREPQLVTDLRGDI